MEWSDGVPLWMRCVGIEGCSCEGNGSFFLTPMHLHTAQSRFLSRAPMYLCGGDLGCVVPMCVTWDV